MRYSQDFPIEGSYKFRIILKCERRHLWVSYDNLSENIDILINTTPVGTYLDIDAKPVDLSVFSKTGLF